MGGAEAVAGKQRGDRLVQLAALGLVEPGDIGCDLKAVFRFMDRNLDRRLRSEHATKQPPERLSLKRLAVCLRGGYGHRFGSDERWGGASG